MTYVQLLLLMAPEVTSHFPFRPMILSCPQSCDTVDLQSDVSVLLRVQVIQEAADEKSSAQALSAADVVQAVLTQKGIVLAEGCLIMSPAGVLQEGSHQIPLRFSVPGSADKPMLSLSIKLGNSAEEPSGL